jgi:tetratricopeptide (TPR) repeat protein
LRTASLKLDSHHLAALGFTPIVRQSWTLWRLAIESVDENTSRKISTPLDRTKGLHPWQLKSLEIAERKGQLSLYSADLTLDLNAVMRAMERIRRKYWGVRTQADYAASSKGIWCLFEFLRSAKKGPNEKRKSLPEGLGSPLNAGMGGFQTQVAVFGSHLSLLFSDHFGIGYVLPGFVQTAMRFAIESYGFDDRPDFECGSLSKALSVHEWRIPILSLILQCLADFHQEETSRALVVQVGESLALARALPQAVFAPDDTGWRLAIKNGEEARHLPYSVTHIPAEILESREKGVGLSKIDNALAQGKYTFASSVLDDCIERDSRDLSYLRRLALLGISGHRDIGRSQSHDVNREKYLLQFGLESENENKLFLSDLLRIAWQQSDQSTILLLASRLGAILASQVSQAESLKAFDVIIPEMLGDAWKFEDHRRAEECYLRILQKRGEIPRVLRKLTLLARDAGRADAEAHFLKRLMKVERRHTELAKIQFRLAELRAKVVTGREEAIQLALSALQFHNSLVGAAFFAADLLVLQGRTEEAIHLLDAQLVGGSAGASNGDRSHIEERIGRIWQENRSRSDLATARYERAIQLDPKNIAAARGLQNIYRENGNFRDLARALEVELSTQEVLYDHIEIKRIFNELVDIYREKLSDPRRAYELYFRLVTSFGLDSQEIERVLVWDDIDIDWHGLYRSLCINLAQIQTEDKKGRLLCRLAEIAREKLGIPGVATDHLREALAYGSIDQQSFSVLVRDLRIAKDYSSLVKSYEKMLTLVPQHEQLPFILELLETPEILSEKRRDALALQALRFDLGNDAVVKKRFLSYQERDDVGGISDLLDQVIGMSEVSRFQKSKWIRLATEVLAGCLDESRFEAAHRFFKLQLDIGEDQIGILQDAIAFLKNSPDISTLYFFVQKMMKDQVLPDLDERFMTRLLHGHDLDLAVFHRLLSIQEEIPEISSGNARIAANIFKKRGEYVYAEEMIARVCVLTPCSDVDLQDLLRLVEKSGHWNVLAKAYETQIKFEDEKEKKFQLMFRLADIFKTQMKDLSRAREILQEALPFAASPSRVMLEIAEIARDEGDSELEKRSLNQFVSESQAIKDLEKFGKCFARLIELGEVPAQMQKILGAHLDHSFKRSRFTQASKLCEIALSNGLSSLNLYKIAFHAALRARDTRTAIEMWSRALSVIPNTAKAQSFLEETIHLAEELRAKDVLLESFEKALSLNVAGRLGPRTKKEILIRYAQLLFDDDQKRKSSLPIYEEAYRLDPEDQRTWIPLYFVLSEFGVLQRIRSHLEAIVPKLQVDQRPLKSFPLTIEFLQGELDQLRRLPGTQSTVPTHGVEHGMQRNLTQDNRPSGLESLYSDQANSMSFVLDLPPLPAGVESSGNVAQILPDDSLDAHEERLNIAGALVDSGPLTQDFSGISAKIKADISQQNSEAGVVTFDLAGGDQDNIAATPKSETSEMSEIANSLSAFEIGGAAVALPSFREPVPSSEPELRIVGSSDDLSGSRHPEGQPSGNIVPDVELGPIPSSVPNQERFVETNSEGFSLDAGLIHDLPASESGISDESLHSSAFDISSRFSLSESVVPKSDSDLGESADLPQIPEHTSSFSESNQDATIGLLAEEGLTKNLDVADLTIQETDQVLTGVRKRHAARHDAADETVDWRTVVLTGDFNANLTDKLLGQAFANELEKHLAVQTVSLVAGNIVRLMGVWHWRVWRHPEEYGYSLRGKERYPRGSTSILLHSPLLKLMIALSPLLVAAYPDRFGLNSLSLRLKTKPRTIERLRKPLAWDQGVLSRVGLGHFARRMKERGHQAYNLPSLGSNLFYDGVSKVIYLDEAYYQRQPSSHLFHRVLETMWMVRLNYYVPLMLHPTKEILESLLFIHDRLKTKGIARIARNLMPESSHLGRAIAKSDISNFHSFFDKTGIPTANQIQEVTNVMRMQIYYLILCETLDVIGLMEAIVDRDLLRNPLRHSEIFQLSSSVLPLLEFVNRIKI